MDNFENILCRTNKSDCQLIFKYSINYLNTKTNSRKKNIKSVSSLLFLTCILILLRLVTWTNQLFAQALT